MSEGQAKPEILPGDLITGPGVYMSRSNNPVEVRDCGNGYWEAAWEHGDLRYHSSGERVGVSALDDPYQLIRWVGPLAEDIPTTSEQLAEIEGQPQSEPVQVREGRWRTRGGQVRNVTLTPGHDSRALQYPWWDAQSKQVWTQGGKYYTHISCELDLAEYLGPLEQQPEIQPEPQQQPESDAELRITLLKQANDTQAETIKRLMVEARDLNMEIGGLQRQLSQRDARIQDLETIYSATTKSFEDANKANDALRVQNKILQQEAGKKASRIEFLETLNAGNGAAIDNYRAMVAKLQGLVDTARQQLEAAATERDELRAAIDAADKQLDQKDAQIRDLRIELDAAQQVPQPAGDEERERIWDQATEQAGQQVIRWLRPLTGALIKQPDERFCRFMAMTLSILPDILPQLLGYAVEDESLDSDGESE